MDPLAQLREDELDAVKARRVTGITSSKFEGCSARISGLAYQTLAVTCIPTSLRTGDREPLGRSVLGNTFGGRDILLVQWVLGNSLVDPVNRPRILFLYGPEGGTIMSSLPGVCTTMFRDLLGNPKARLTDAEKADLLKYRVVTYGDVQIEDGKLNTAIWRDIGSGDSVAIGSGRGRLNATCVVASNFLWYQKSAYLKRWFARRTLAIRLRKPAVNLPPPPQVFTDLECCRFALECVRARLRYVDPPVSPSTVLLTLLGHRAPVATRGIVEDPSATFLMALTATYSVAIAAQTDVDRLVDLAASMSGAAVVSRGGLRAIAGIRPALT